MIISYALSRCWSIMHSHLSDTVCAYVYECVCVREREKEREKSKEKKREYYCWCIYKVWLKSPRNKPMNIKSHAWFKLSWSHVQEHLLEYVHRASVMLLLPGSPVLTRCIVKFHHGLPTYISNTNFMRRIIAGYVSWVSGYDWMLFSSFQLKSPQLRRDNTWNFSLPSSGCATWIAPHSDTVNAFSEFCCNILRGNNRNNLCMPECNLMPAQSTLKT